ncbi:MAG: class I SAM-dependent methyltransferase [Methanosarcinales archaeon]
MKIIETKEAKCNCKKVYLRKLIEENKYRRIMEIGVAVGGSAEEMIKGALKNFSEEKIKYYGFDLFTTAWYDKYNGDLMEDVERKLAKTGADINLFRGDTRKILKTVLEKIPLIDFVYIDGGHKREEVKNDWEAVKRVVGSKTLIVFDDYHLKGVKKVVDSINEKEFEKEIVKLKELPKGLMVEVRIKSA